MEACRLEPRVGALCDAWLKAYLENSDPDKVITDFTEAMRVYSTDPEGHLIRGAACVAKGEHDKAIADFTEATRLNPNYAEAYFNRGVAYGDRGEKVKAARDFAHAKTLGYETTQDEWPETAIAASRWN